MKNTEGIIFRIIRYKINEEMKRLKGKDQICETLLFVTKLTTEKLLTKVSTSYL